MHGTLSKRTRVLERSPQDEIPSTELPPDPLPSPPPEDTQPPLPSETVPIVDPATASPSEIPPPTEGPAPETTTPLAPPAPPPPDVSSPASPSSPTIVIPQSTSALSSTHTLAPTLNVSSPSLPPTLPSSTENIASDLPMVSDTSESAAPVGASSRSVNPAPIVGGILAGLFVVLLVGSFLWFRHKRRKTPQRSGTFHRERMTSYQYHDFTYSSASNYRDSRTNMLSLDTDDTTSHPSPQQWNTMSRTMTPVTEPSFTPFAGRDRRQEIGERILQVQEELRAIYNQRNETKDPTWGEDMEKPLLEKLRWLERYKDSDWAAGTTSMVPPGFYANYMS